MKKCFCVVSLVFLILLTFAPVSAVWVSDGVFQPNFYSYTFDDLGHYGTNANLVIPFCVYWPNSSTGKIDMFCGSYFTIQDSGTGQVYLNFYAASGSNDARISITTDGSTPGTCRNFLYPDQVYSYSEFCKLSPGVDFYFLGNYSDNINSLFTTSAERSNTPGGSVDPTPEPGTKSNIYASMRDTIIYYFFNGEAVAGSIEFNIATLISFVCCIAIILLPFLACWAIVRLFIWR